MCSAGRAGSKNASSKELIFNVQKSHVGNQNSLERRRFNVNIQIVVNRERGPTVGRKINVEKRKHADDDDAKWKQFQVHTKMLSRQTDSSCIRYRHHACVDHVGCLIFF